MKDEDSLPLTTPVSSSSASSSSCTFAGKKEASSDNTLFGKGRYKFWALAAILLLAFWSMFTGTVTLRWSAGRLNRLSDAINDNSNPIRDDLDVLEMEEREKVVKYMWDVYTNSRRIGLPRFWQEAFEAAYEDMTSDVPGFRDAAITEIAKMSIRSIGIDSPPIHITDAGDFSLKHAQISNAAGVS